MRAWGMAGLAVAAAVAGCGAPAPADPLPTDGPNQVVVAVPGMH